MIPYGAAASVGGAALSSIGSQQGANALAGQTTQEMNQQLATQQQADKAMSAFIGNSNPTQLQQQDVGQFANPSNALLQQMSTYKPMGLSGAAAQSFQGANQANATSLQAANIRLARQHAAARAKQQQQTNQGNLADTQTQLEATNARQRQLDQINNMIAAQKGQGLRAAGGLLMTAGGIAGGAQGFASAAGGGGGGGGGGAQPNMTYDPNRDL